MSVFWALDLDDFEKESMFPFCGKREKNAFKSNVDFRILRNC